MDEGEDMLDDALQMLRFFVKMFKDGGNGVSMEGDAAATFAFAIERLIQEVEKHKTTGRPN